MIAFLATDTRIYHVNDKYFADNSFVPIISRYQAVFKDIKLCTRIYDMPEQPDYCSDISHLISEYLPINNLYDVLKHKKKQELKRVISPCDIVIVRIPSIVSYQVANIAIKLHKPYLSEVIGCAWDGYFNHSILGKCVAPYMFFKMKQVAFRSDFATYVTTRFLQNRYPCRNDSIGVSDVNISKLEDSIIKARIAKIGSADRKKIILLTAAGVNVRAKGQAYVIRAIRRLAASGIDVRYYLAGKGDQSYLKHLADKEGVSDSVIFFGGVSRDNIMKLYDETDIYIQPSKQEGLPRAVIEAMSRGCPVLGSDTGGIPELIQNECIFRKGSVKAIVAAVENIVLNDFAKYAKANFENAKQFQDFILDEKRMDYYRYITEKLQTLREKS